MAAYEKSFYKQVAANTTDDWELVIPNGDKYFVEEMGGSAANNTNVYVAVLWDGVVEFATHSSGSRRSNLCCEGDGVKKLIIRLKNDTNNQETMGGYILAEKYS